MTLKSVKFLLLIFVFCACHKAQTTQKVESERLAINQNSKTDTEIDAFLKPYRERLEASLNEVLCYSIEEHKKTDGALNTAVGNLMADAVFERCAPILKKRHNLDLDLVLLNHGGIRAPLPKGPIKMKTAFNIMPFENKVVIAQMKGTALMELVDYLRKAKRAHPISGMKLAISREGDVKTLLVQGENVEPNTIYNVATNDYLYKGGDRMDFFQNSETVFDIDYKIRNVLIDYFTAKDTLNPKRDDRFGYTN
jgi:5'-nucleotidase